MSWFKKFKAKRANICRLCRKNPISEESAILKLDTAEGIHEVRACEECIGHLSPIIGGDLD